MELREYGQILRRRWWLILLLPLLASLFTLLTHRESPPTYGYTLKYSVSFLPAPRESMDQDPRLGAVQAAEYVADDLTEIFQGSRFASLVGQYLPEGASSPPLGATRAEKQHRIVTLSFSAPTTEQASQIAGAIRQATEQDLDGLLNQMWGTGELQLELIHDSGAFPLAGGLRSRLDLPLRVALALAAAVALAFALDYLDDSIRSREEVEGLVGPVLGEIPK